MTNKLPCVLIFSPLFVCVFNLYLFDQLAVVLFNLNADGYSRVLSKQVLQQSKLPVRTAAVATCTHIHTCGRTCTLTTYFLVTY